MYFCRSEISIRLCPCEYDPTTQKPLTYEMEWKKFNEMKGLIFWLCGPLILLCGCLKRVMHFWSDMCQLLKELSYDKDHLP